MSLPSFQRYQELTEQVNLYNDFHTLGIPRSQMPQIKSYKLEAFELYLKSNGFSIKKDFVEVEKLKLTQADVDMRKVVRMAQNINKVRQKYVIVSNNDYILDGHHRIFALQMTHPKQKIRVHRVNMDIKELLKIALKWDGSTQEDLL